MFNTYGVKVLPRGILKQIYFKESKSTILKSKKDSIMYVRANKIKQFAHDFNTTEKSLILYIMCEGLKTDKDNIVNSMLVVLDGNNPKTISGIKVNRNNFYAAINSFVDKGVLMKYKPKHYLVNPYYFSVLTDEQVNFLRRHKYHLLSESQEFSSTDFEELDKLEKAGN